MAATSPQQSKVSFSSQQIINNFWKSKLVDTGMEEYNPPSVLPSNVYAQMIREHVPKGDVGGKSISASYEEAVKECEVKVAQIVAECRRDNKKYSDPHFDLDDFDFCLRRLSAKSDTPTDPADQQESRTITYDVTQRSTSTGRPIFRGDIQSNSQQQSAADDPQPDCAKRVGDIFDNPKFYVGGGANIKDTRQGADGDCWFLSSLDSLCVGDGFPHLIERICPERARDEKVGVYGFVFNRDGEWISEIIDDKLYLSAPDYDDCDDERRSVWDRSHFRLDPEVSREEYRKTFQRNSDALFYGSCSHPDETWVPLLEKAFAKAHGDYSAINGGWPGEGVEDLTGGVSTEIVSADILDKDQLWTEGLLKVNKEFLFGAGTRKYWHPDPDQKGRQGIEDGHAYSVLKATTYRKTRLLLVKNPWGKTEWNGPWSDGSKEWTAEALNELDYTFGDDGIFWMPYEDFLRRYDRIWRTRLFTPDWNVSQHWSTIQVPWSGDYNDTKFEFVISKPTRVVILVSQLDDSYFQGLTGQYSFDLSFRLHRAREKVHLVRGYSSGHRSATTEVDLDAGTYEVLLQISGCRDSSLPKIEDVVMQNWLSRRDKLLRIGLSYDLAHAKGQNEEIRNKNKQVVKRVQGAAAKDEKKADTETVIVVKDAQDAAIQPPTTGVDPSHNLEKPADIERVPQSDSGDAKSPAKEPWSAACVVSLRVFCHKTIATTRVVRPKKDDVTVETKAELDVDDPEKDATERRDLNDAVAK